LLNKQSKGSDSSGRQEFYKNCRKNLAPESCSTTSSFFRRYIGEACSQIGGEKKHECVKLETQTAHKNIETASNQHSQRFLECFKFF